jgi:CRISPR-associated protein Cmr3
MTAYYFVEPADSLFVRGNLAFGDSGEHGVSSLPPPPSLFAGAFRSALLGRQGEALAAFLSTGRTGRTDLDAALGRVDPVSGAVVEAGCFRVAWVSLAGRRHGSVEAVVPLPADLVRLESGFAHLTPGDGSDLVESNRTLPRAAVLRSAKQEKPQTGHFLGETGFRAHLDGTLPDIADGVESRHLHKRDPRLGIGLNGPSRTAETGLIYTTEGFAFNPPGGECRFDATGFLVGLDGADGLLPDSGMLRLGGDGRAAAYRRIDYAPPEIPVAAIGRDRRFRLILMTPGLFSSGWLPEGCRPEENGGFLWRGEGFTARLVCAAVPRREIVSGWDLFRWKPKAAERAVPAGSVYWFDDFRGDAGKLAEWVETGLGGDNSRRAEGFNLARVGAWN